MPASKKDADPYADWSDEDKELWESTAHLRERQRKEDHASLLEEFKRLLFEDPDSGGTLDPDGDDAAKPPAGTGEGGRSEDDGPGLPRLVSAPFWDRRIFARKASSSS